MSVGTMENTTKMRKVKSIALLLAVSLSLSSCQGENEGFGTLIGAGLGAFIGHEIGGHGDGAVIGTLIGTAVGAGICGSVGRQMDKGDRLAAALGARCDQRHPQEEARPRRDLGEGREPGPRLPAPRPPVTGTSDALATPLADPE